MLSLEFASVFSVVQRIAFQLLKFIKAYRRWSFLGTIWLWFTYIIYHITQWNPAVILYAKRRTTFYNNVKPTILMRLFTRCSLRLYWSQYYYNRPFYSIKTCKTRFRVFCEFFIILYSSLYLNEFVSVLRYNIIQIECKPSKLSKFCSSDVEFNTIWPWS